MCSAASFTSASNLEIPNQGRTCENMQAFLAPTYVAESQRIRGPRIVPVAGITVVLLRASILKLTSCRAMASVAEVPLLVKVNIPISPAFHCAAVHVCTPVGTQPFVHFGVSETLTS